MKAGDLDRRLQFRRATPLDDGFTKSENWEDHGAPVWASRRDVSDGEKAKAGAVSAELSTRFRVRSSAFTRGITPKDRFLSDGLQWEIVGLKEIGRLDGIEITAVAKLDRDNA
ncbi:head-tail adaptor protein [Pseudooceanicola sp. C21-150M6]|uniref:head-tail adaptor protein n=1 Tax=Pseudooceanicola sp. C21-150M6 TaxID=3434355 RepID=UPI003D7FBCB9